MSWIAAATSGFIAGGVNAWDRSQETVKDETVHGDDRLRQAISEPLQGKAPSEGYPDIYEQSEAQVPTNRERVDYSKDPRWGEAREVREEGHELSREAGRHSDNALAAFNEWRVNEGLEESRQAFGAAYESEKKYYEANTIENQIAQDASAQNCIIC